MPLFIIKDMKKVQILLLIFILTCSSNSLNDDKFGKKAQGYELAVIDFKEIDKTWGGAYLIFDKAAVEYGSNEISGVWKELMENQGECSEWTVNASTTIFQLLYDIDRYFQTGELFYKNPLAHYLTLNYTYPNEVNIPAHIYLNLAILSYANEIEINRISIESLGTLGGEKTYYPSFQLVENYINEFAKSIKKCDDNSELFTDITINDLQDMTLSYIGENQQSRMSMYELVIVKLFPSAFDSELFD